MMSSSDFISNSSFWFKNENGEVISLNGQLITFTLSVKEVWKWTNCCF